MRNQSLMEVNGLFATINTPKCLKGEETYNLPPYSECPAYVVDEYPSCPPNWMHGSANASSYFVPVKAGRGMWFDFTANINHPHHVAVVISVQGINPITGQQVTKLNLEKYQNQCPVHKVDFQNGRYCPECGYRWPAQSYIATTTNQILWLDGFRNEDGTVRQYIITEEEIRGIAKQMIGDDRVYAIGFAFYISKNPKPGFKVNYGPMKSENCSQLSNSYTSSSSSSSSSSGSVSSSSSTPWYKPSGSCRILKGYPPSNTISPSIRITPGYPQDDAKSLQQLASGDASLDMYYPTQLDADGNEYSLETGIPSIINFGNASIPETIQFQDTSRTNKNSRAYDPYPHLKDDDYIPTVMDPESFCPRQRKKSEYLAEMAKRKETKLEIGAGAKIWQEIGHDPESLDFWQEEPAGLIYVNYVTEEKAQEIMSAGKIASKKEGFLNGCLVGS